MKQLSLLILSVLIFAAATAAQTTPAVDTKKDEAAAEKPKRVSFRANKDQITEAQTKLKTAGSYSGEADGKMNDDFRASVKTYQEANGLRRSGSLNRATLEKMGIALTDAQKEIPIPESSYVKAKDEKAPDNAKESKASVGGPSAGTDKAKRGPVFRANKDQINEAQRKLKADNMYAGEETGKLDDDTRTGLRKYQQANGLKVTGTLNAVTLEKMGIALTDRQKEIAAGQKK
jgi:peptidoglycan hydrolase-like protein with peptidoglycan-binding domain